MSGRLLALLGVMALGTSACHRHSEGSSAAVDGAIIFASSCARCHGTDGCGSMASNPVGTPRHLCDKVFQSGITDAQIRQTIQKGKGMMPGFGDDFSEAQIQALVKHVRQLKSGS